MQSPQNNVLRSRSIGAILIDSGKLSTNDAEKIIVEQKKNGLQFGDAAIRLGLLDEKDIQLALANQFNYPYLVQGDTSISQEAVAAFDPFSPVVEQLRALRTQLMLRWFDAGTRSKSLAIVSPARGEGRSYLAANLAIVFSQLGEKTLLIDADLRNPRQHQLFKIGNSAGLSAVLSGRAALDEAAVKVEPLRGLSVLPAGATPPNPQELLGRPEFSGMLNEYGEIYEVIIIDTPAAQPSADTQTIAARAGAALLAAHNNHTLASSLQNLAASLQDAGVVLVGSVLNDF